MGYHISDIPQIISYRIWFARKLTCLMATVILSYFAYAFEDYNVMNNKLLQDIQGQNLELRKSLDALQLSHYQNSALSQSSFLRMGEHQHTFSDVDVTDDTTRVIEDINDSDSDDSTLSFNSTQTDRTWMAEADTTINDNYSDESCDESIYDEDVLDISELNKTFTIEDAVKNLDKAMEAHVENVSSTSTIRNEMRSSRSPSLNKSTNLAVSSSNYSTPTRIRRRSCTPVISENPVLHTESPNSFGKLVKKMAKIAEKNSKKVREVVQREKELQAAMSPMETKKKISTIVFSDDE